MHSFSTNKKQQQQKKKNPVSVFFKPRQQTKTKFLKMSESKYSPTSGDVPQSEPKMINNNNNNNNAAAAAAPTAPIDLFADNNQVQQLQLPPPNDIYIGEVVSTNASSNMQPSVRPGHHSVVITPANTRNTGGDTMNNNNNTQFTFQQPQSNNSSYQNQPQHHHHHHHSHQFGGAPTTTSLADTPLPENVQQEWDAVTEVTVLSSRLRILYVCELLVIIVNAIVFAWSCIAIPFCIAGYIAVRWFKYYFAIAGMITFLVMVPIAIVTAILTKTDGGFEAFAFVVICIVSIFWHIWVCFTTFKFMTALKKLSAENLEQVQREMPAVCGCL